MATKTVVKIGADITEFERKMEEVGSKLSSIGNKFSDIGKSLTASVTVPIVGIGTMAIKSASEFEAGMSNIKAVSGATGEDMKKLSDLALQAGKDTAFSASEASKGIEELIKAGLSTEQVMNGGLVGALNLASAGELELGEAAEIASTALNAFKADGLSVGKAGDILAGAANASATSVGELKYGLSSVASVASSVGLSFEDTTTALAVFAQNGLKGSDAGTSLKTMLMNLQPSTDAQYELFQRLNLMTFDTGKAMDYLAKNGIKTASGSVEDITKALKTHAAEMSGTKEGTAKAEKAYRDLAGQIGVTGSAFYDSNGKLKSMADISGILQSNMSDLTDAQRLQAMETIFGSDAIRAANILFKEGTDGVNTMKSAMGNVTAEETAKEKLNNFNGSLEQLRGSLETLGIQIGTIFLPRLKEIADYLTGVINKFMELSPQQQDQIIKFAAIAAAIGPVILIVGKLISFFSSLVSILVSVGAAVTNAGGLIAILSNPITIIIAAVGALVAAFISLYNTNEEFRDKVNSVWSQIQQMAETIFGYLKQFWQQWGDDVLAIFKGLWDSVSIILNLFVDAFKIAFPLIQGVVVNAIKYIGDILGGLIEILRGIIDFIVGVFTGDWDRAWTGIKSIFVGIFDTIVGYISGVANTITGIIGGIIGSVKEALSWFGKLFSAKDKASKDNNSSYIPAQSGEMPSSSGQGADTSDVGWYATGGVFDKASVIGVGEETGVEEAVVPLSGSHMKPFAEKIASLMGNVSGGMTFNQTFNNTGSLSPSEVKSRSLEAGRQLSVEMGMI